MPPVEGKETNETKSSAGENITSFYEIASRDGLSKAYKTYAADDVRALREETFPISGKDNLLAEEKKNKSKLAAAKRNIFFSAADLAYFTSSYVLTKKDNSMEKGNFVQFENCATENAVW